ncbi:Exosome complex component RRP41 [Rhizophlyctis rosea]|uniref:Ribosomal RNA-processing protein 41 n=1 Tax=Rhizophlyctis rosea TaxID=64517 RepID=A0AAD5SEI2_9FUNG|nr:Exosome complex component RRP41 [Rhizophlyctis rosea]
MSRFDIVSPEGLRVDGRRPPELRRLSCRTGVFAQADGSAYIEQGNTKCLVAVYGPREPSKRLLTEKGPTINVEYNVASFSSGERKTKMRKDRRLMEIASVIKQTFEPIICYGQNVASRSEIDVNIQILQLDGGALHAAINATTLAMIDAGVPMRDFVCACSAGWYKDTALLDLNHLEESADVPTLTVGLLPKSGKVTLLSLESRLHLDKFQSVLELASQGCERMRDELDSTIRKATQELAKTAL